MPKIATLTHTLPYIGLRRRESRSTLRKSIPSLQSLVRRAKDLALPKAKRAKLPGVVSPSNTRRYLAYGLIAFNLIMFVSYFLSINQGVATGYAIKKLQTNISNLQEQNQKLTLQASEVGSILRVQQELATSGFVPATGGLYIDAPHQYSQR